MGYMKESISDMEEGLDSSEETLEQVIEDEYKLRVERRIQEMRLAHRRGFLNGLAASTLVFVLILILM